VENGAIVVIFVSEKSGELSGKPVDHREVEGAKVLVKRKVGEVLVDIEEKGIFEVLWRNSVRNPKEFIWRRWVSKQRGATYL